MVVNTKPEHPTRRPARTTQVKNRKPEQQPDKPGLPARRVATKLLGAVIDAHTSLDGLIDNAHGHPTYLALDMRDRALVRAIVMSALRHRMSIQALLDKRLDRPLPANAHALSHLLHAGAAQILFLDVPDSAAVDLAVTQAKNDPRMARFANMVNGVLRNLARVKERALPSVLAKTQDAPAWFVERLERAYGAQKAGEILAAQRSEPPVDFTVKDDPDTWAKTLSGTLLPNGSVRVARLENYVPELPGYAEGEWWVQDAAASLPAKLFGDVKGLRVADLCAAPGGKTAQLAHAGASVTAIDLSKSRLKRLRENLTRLKLSVEIVEADLKQFAVDSPFDAVLLDAPCSSTGTVRRHPDVPWSKTAADIEKLAGIQRQLLERAVTLVKPGGTIVFSNCSLDPLEGEEMVRAFLADTPQVELVPIRPEELPGMAHLIDAAGMLRTTPADRLADMTGVDMENIAGFDGFFAARLKRIR